MVDPGFTKGGGHKIMDLLSLRPHIYKNYQNHKVGGGQK